MVTYITQSVADTSGFEPDIWAQEALAILAPETVLSRTVAQDSDFAEGDYARVGQTLNIGYAGTYTAQDKVANTLLAASVPTGGATTGVTLNKHKVVPFVIEDIAQAQSNQNLMRRYLEPAIVALATAVESDLFSAANLFNALSIGTIGTDITSASLRAAQKLMNTAKAPQADRHFIYSPKDLAALEADNTLQNYFNFNPSNGMVEDGSPNRPLYGFQPHMSQLVPATAGSGHAVQTITVTGTSGHFTVTYAGQTTGSIPYGSTGAFLEAALQALSTIGVGMARVSPYDSTGKIYTIVLYVATPAAFTTTDTTLTTAVADSALVATSNLAYHKNAIILASRPIVPLNAAQTVASSYIEDPKSGLVINLQAQYSAQAMGLWVNASILYGVATLRPDQGAVVLA